MRLMNTSKALRWFIALTGLILFGFVASGCGGENPCASRSCYFGTCESGSGQCINKPSCQTDKDCVPGYACGQQGECVAENTCGSDDDCSMGICDGGACVNPDGCQSNSDCVPRTYCGESQSCEPDPCNSTMCERGVCERGTADCVAAERCTKDLDCLANEKCLQNECVARQDYCNQLTCERGVCSYEEGGCVNAGDCEGDRAKCQEGFFCNDMNRCQEDLCVENNRNCGEDGVCVPTTGQCDNAESCEDSDQCTDGFLCVEGECREEHIPCGNAQGDGGCPGNQVCKYEEETNTAPCVEPDVCETSIDCHDERACGGKSCLDPVSCKKDQLEPNDAMGQATDVFAEAADGRVRASLCQQDTDRYSVSTTDVVSPAFSGQLVATVTVPKRDIGLGEATLTMNGPDGGEIGTADLGAMGQDGSMTVTTGLQDTDHGTYTLEVSPGEEMTQNGLEYWLSVRIEKPGATAACDDADPLQSGQRVTGDTSSPSGTGLGSTCTAEDNPSAGDVYALEIDRPQKVTIEATPTQDQGDVSLSLRDRCRQIATEQTCADRNGPGSAESLTTLLSEDTYYVVVQSPAGASLGPYTLTVNRHAYTTCGPGSDYCVDGSTAALCGPEGSDFTQVSCDAGCNSTFGECFPPEGDVCQKATPISISQGGSQSQLINLRQYNDDYSVSAGHCLGNQPRSEGPDAAYEVTIPGRTTFTATANFEDGVRGSMYFADDCADIDGTCSKGAQGDDNTPYEEEIFYGNTSENAVTKTLIVDTEAVQPGAWVQLDFKGEELVCPPGGGICTMNGTQAKHCNKDGTAVTRTESCGPIPCQNGRCPGNDCSAPLDITQAARNNANGVTHGPFSWNDFDDDYKGSGCSVDPGYTNGFETVLRADLQAGETITAKLQSERRTADYAPTSIYIQNTCTALSESTCLAGESNLDETASAYYYASAPQTVFIFGASDQWYTNETFSLDVNISQTTCVPGSSSCSGGDVQACAGDGLSQHPYTCSSGCTNGFCNDRDSDICWDAENITSQLNAPGGINRTIDFANFSNDIETDMCGLTYEDMEGQDAVYAVDLQPNEQLSALLDQMTHPPNGTLYVIGNCSNLKGSCKTAEHGFVNSLPSVNYTAGSSPERVYLVADHDANTAMTPSFPFTLTGSIQ